MKRIIANTALKEVTLYDVSDAYLLECNEKGSIYDQKILDYCERATYLGIFLDKGSSIFDSSIKILNNNTTLTDGTWIWSADLNYYYQYHHFIWPNEFINAIKKNNYKVPVLNNEMLDNLDLIDMSISKLYNPEIVYNNSKINDSLIRSFNHAKEW